MDTELAKLKEEIKELKAENDFLDTYEKQEALSQIKELKEEKDFWIKEYHELKQKVDWGPIEDYSMRIDELIDKNNKQYKELKIKNDELKDIKELNSSWAKKRDYDGEQYRIIINELKKENEELKDKIEDSDSE